jgi:hypothetical protein
MSPVIAPLEALPAPTQSEPRIAEAPLELVVVHESSTEFDFLGTRPPRRWTGRLATSRGRSSESPCSSRCGTWRHCA